jgi:hypothetical protein
MSDLHGLSDSAGDPGTAGDPALPPPPDDWLLRDFLQVRALAQHINVVARLDAFAAAHDAAKAEAPDGGGIRLRWDREDDDPDAPPFSPGDATPQPTPAPDPAATGPVPPDAASQSAPQGASPGPTVPEPVSPAALRPDPIGHAGGISLDTSVGNDSLNLDDRTGLCPDEICGGASPGADPNIVLIADKDTKKKLEFFDKRAFGAAPSPPSGVGLVPKLIPPTVGDPTTYLYQKVGPNGEHLKFGITGDPDARYTTEERGGASLRIIGQGSRQDMLQIERTLHENLPIGPEEGQRFYIKKQIDKGLKSPPYEWYAMKYRIILQWPGSSIEDYDDLIQIEYSLSKILSDGSYVDGHDVGSDEVNIFIDCDDPHQTFGEVKAALKSRDEWSNVRIAYRSMEASKYTVLWPSNLHEFKVT